MRHAGPVRGSSSGQRYGRGRGGYKSVQRDRKPSSFNTTRIEENASSDAEHSDEVSAHKIDQEDSSTGYSNDEEHEPNKAQVKPYNMLLQHLAATPQPQHKRRKMNETENIEDAEKLENYEDLVEEPEESEALGADDFIDPEDELEPGGGSFGPVNIDERLY